MFKMFPKKKSQTIFDDNEFVYYRRQGQHGRFFLKNVTELGNCYIVPYNKELILRYNAHINIEISCQTMLIKYLFKYVSKGSNRCRMAIEGDKNDEIKSYLNCRFVCPCKAVWRLLQFPIQSKSLYVERLQVHLPQHHNIIFSGNLSLP